MSTTSRGLRPFSPQSFGRYTLLTQLATGGMGAVYLARITGAEGFQKLVVIKKILPRLALEPTFLERFLDEARLVVQLQHGSIAQILDMGCEGGEYYIAMEFVDGKDLCKVAARARELKRPLPASLVLYAMVRVLDALAYAHRKKDENGRELNLVHRDISPQNVLISYEGEVKVIDFGLAKSAQTLGRTQPHVLLGKFFYMAPEVARHQPMDRRCDLYAAGVCLWEFLAGKNPFDGIKPFDVMRAVANPEIPPIRALRPELPASLEQTLEKALAIDPAQRFSSAEEMRGRLSAEMLELDPGAGPEALAALVRELFGPEFESERRTLATLSRWKPEPADPPVASAPVPVPVPAPPPAPSPVQPPVPVGRQATAVAPMPSPPKPLSRQETEILPPGFLPGPLEPRPEPASTHSLIAAPAAAQRTATPSPGLSAQAPVRRTAQAPAAAPASTSEPPVSTTPPVPEEPPAAASEDLHRDDDSRTLVAPMGAAPGRAAVRIPPELFAKSVESEEKTPATLRLPGEIAQAHDGPCTPRTTACAGPEGPSMSRKGVPQPQATWVSRESDTDRSELSSSTTVRSPSVDAPPRRFILFLAAATVALFVVAIAGALLSPDHREAPKVVEGPPAARPIPRPLTSAAEPIDRARPPAADPAAAGPVPEPSEGARLAAPPRPVDVPSKPAPSEDDPPDLPDADRGPVHSQEQLRAQFAAIARELEALKARKSCEEIGLVCTNWKGIEKLYHGKLRDPTEANLKSLAAFLTDTRRALNDAKRSHGPR